MDEDKLLRSRLIRLAKERPEHRAALLPLIKDASATKTAGAGSTVARALTMNLIAMVSPDSPEDSGALVEELKAFAVKAAALPPTEQDVFRESLGKFMSMLLKRNL